MKTFFSLFVVLAILLAIYPFINPSENDRSLTGLPWQIDVLPGGSTQVFGLSIGSSRLSDALAVLGNDVDLAIIAASGEPGSLEMYYGYYKAGLLSGKLVLQTNTSEQDIKNWRNNSPKSEYMATGNAKKYFLSEHDITGVLQQMITGITFIPAVNLDEEVILARFGKPQQIIQMADVTHYLYPQKGLHIALSKSSKEVLQYVSPSQFSQLIEPLLTEIEQ